MNKKDVIMRLIGVFCIIMIFVLVVFGYPMIKPWWAEKDGQAELAQAEQNRQIAVLEAKALKESAIYQAGAEIERAKGVAEANKIIGDSLEGNDAYLKYLWIQGLHDGSSETIYIPTEANLPVLEATRLSD